MEFSDLLRRRRMVRAYKSTPISDEVLLRVCTAAQRAPSAGNTDAIDLLLLSTPEQVASYWAVTLPAERRDSFRWQGLLSAPALLLIWTRPDAYVERYSEPDKNSTGLDTSTLNWSVPYWWVDGGGSALAVQLAAQDEGLGCLFFGLFGHEEALREQFGVPSDRRAIGAITLGYPASSELGRSAVRARREVEAMLHRAHW